jgi:hypothetical protein
VPTLKRVEIIQRAYLEGRKKGREREKVFLKVVVTKNYS